MPRSVSLPPGATASPPGAGAPCTLCEPAALAQLLHSHPGAQALWQALPRQRLESGQDLVRAQTPLRHYWWVEQGLLRSYYLDASGAQWNRAFHPEGVWVGHGTPPLPSPSPFHMGALEPCTLVVVSYAQLQTLQQQYPVLELLLQEAVNSLLVAQARREASLLGQSPAQRYQAFVREHPHLHQRVPLHHVASYLGVSNVSLSRIRARLGMVGKGTP